MIGKPGLEYAFIGLGENVCIGPCAINLHNRQSRVGAAAIPAGIFCLLKVFQRRRPLSYHLLVEAMGPVKAATGGHGDVAKRQGQNEKTTVASGNLLTGNLAGRIMFWCQNECYGNISLFASHNHGHSSKPTSKGGIITSIAATRRHPFCHLLIIATHLRDSETKASSALLKKADPSKSTSQKTASGYCMLRKMGHCVLSSWQLQQNDPRRPKEVSRPDASTGGRPFLVQGRSKF